MKVQLFVTCLGENLLPHMLQKMVGILERIGVTCEFPENQTCCGQPFFNSGFQKKGREMALRWMKAFSGTEGHIVAPSGSCLMFVKHRYPLMFPEGTAEHQEAVRIAGRVCEFSQFLVKVLKVTDLGASFPHRVACHSPCHLTRGLGVRDEQRILLNAVRGLDLVPLNEEETCCGFGGIFSVAYPEVSMAMMEAKLRNIAASTAEYVVVSEPGCLINIRGGLQKMNSNVQALHLIELLAMGGAA
ncbi:MAG TPA: (Fe-S)-binding protein [Syntrophales bacterium]|nr:(Fe-S)-binding protein [Syntrophales bacterium]HOX93815.1 (Fe-S)-binding protein [Syntrophales bacterium]HPI57744.1 (Fe-S)-binding protein [Syntrophales bacterium]HPN25846.1 (Fe-S)-binding protein [Syntrophales bacterium]HQM30366.1 (Fe-S)-binding protein [Syntrophales bacterium]